MNYFKEAFRVKLDDMEYILEPILNSSKELLGLPISEAPDTRILQIDINEMIEAFDREATKIYSKASQFIDVETIITKYLKHLGLEKTEESANIILSTIDSFIEKGLLVKIEVPETDLRLSSAFRLLITPLGIFFLRCCQEMSPIPTNGLKFEDVFLSASQFLGSAYNEYIGNRISMYLEKMKAALSKQEVTLALFLLLSQAVSRERSVKIGKKPADGDLYTSLRLIGNRVYRDATIFSNIMDVDGAIRRSTGAMSLQAKTLNKYVKERCKGESGHLLFFDLRDENDLSFIVNRLFISIEKHEKQDEEQYHKRVIELLDRHINDRNLIFESKPYIRERLLSDSSIETIYLNNLLRIMKQHVNEGERFLEF